MEIINKIKKLLSRDKKNISYDKPVIKPVKDWVIMLIISQILIFICAVFALYFYIQVDRGDFYSIPENDLTNDAVINSNLLDRTIDYIKDKEEKFNSPVIDIPEDPYI